MKRRDLLVSAAAWTASSAARVYGANERVRVGLIGCGGRGQYVAGFMQMPADNGARGAELVAFCDVYLPNADKARETLTLKNPAADLPHNDANVYQDFRRALDRKDIDAVLVATPDHWHATAAVLALQAGKDVYVEKPFAHNIREGRALVEAQKRFSKNFVQTGTQQRSSPHFAQCAEIVQSGQLGKVHFVRVWNYFNSFPKGIGLAPDTVPPAGLDWDFYLGPAPKVPFNEKRFLKTYRYFWDYAGGWVTDFGTHRHDTVHQIMGVDAPVTVSASGGKYSLDDASETPAMFQGTFEYPDFLMSYEVSLFNGHGLGGRTPGMRYYNMKGAEDRPNGIAFYGTSGALFTDRWGYDLYPEPGAKLQRSNMNERDATPLHAKAFIECVRSRKTPPATAETGHRATIVGHLGNIACRTGRKLHWNPDKEEFIGHEPEATALLGREMRDGWKWI